MNPIRKDRFVNGYKLIYFPNHPCAYKTDSFNGYVYEHIAIAYQKYNRILNDGEEVHHIDHNKLNNNPDNIMVLSRRKHRLLHNILKFYPDFEIDYNNIDETFNKYYEMKKNNLIKSKYIPNLSRRKVERPSKEVLEEELKNNSWVYIGKKYKVTTDSVRKWAKIYGITKPGISRRKVERPSKEVLEEELKNSSWIELDQKYKVSDNTIRNWAKIYGITKSVKEKINKITDFKHRSNKITPEQVIDIRYRYDNEISRVKDLVSEFNVHKTTIIDIVKRRSYKNVQ